MQNAQQLSANRGDRLIGGGAKTRIKESPLEGPVVDHTHVPNVGLVTGDGESRRFDPGAYIRGIDGLFSDVHRGAGLEPHGVGRPQLLKSFRIVQDRDALIELVQFVNPAKAESRSSDTVGEGSRLWRTLWMAMPKTKAKATAQTQYFRMGEFLK
jgi:hypothetical protein